MKFEYNDVILKIDKQLIIEIHKIFKFDYINYKFWKVKSIRKTVKFNRYAASGRDNYCLPAAMNWEGVMSKSSPKHLVK